VLEVSPQSRSFGIVFALEQTCVLKWCVLKWFPDGFASSYNPEVLRGDSDGDPEKGRSKISHENCPRSSNFAHNSCMQDQLHAIPKHCGRKLRMSCDSGA